MTKVGRPRGGQVVLENGLTERQHAIFTSLFEYSRKHGYQPSLRELGEMHGIASPTAVRSHLFALMSRGWIGTVPESGHVCRSVVFLRRPDGTPFRGFER